MQYVLFTHNDLDGSGCDLIFQMAVNHLTEAVEWKSMICTNDNVDEKVLTSLDRGHITKQTNVYFADLVPSEEVLKRLIKERIKVKIWDHHKTAFWVKKYIKDAIIVVENENGVPECGASLMYQYFTKLSEIEPNNQLGFNFSLKHNSNENLILLAELIDAIRSYDTFEYKVTKNMNARYANTLFSLIGSKQFSKKYLKRFTTSEVNELFTETEFEFIKARITTEIAAIERFSDYKMNLVNIGKYSAAVKFTGGDGIPLSEFAYEYLTKHPEIDIFVGINITTGTYSFRTQKDYIDVKKKKKTMHGGGHSKASGCSIPNTIKNETMNNSVKWINKRIKELK